MRGSAKIAWPNLPFSRQKKVDGLIVVIFLFSVRNRICVPHGSTSSAWQAEKMSNRNLGGFFQCCALVDRALDVIGEQPSRRPRVSLHVL